MKFSVATVERLRAHYQGLPVCVTGGAGFIGGHLVDALISLGASITVLDDLSNSTLEHLGSLIELEPRRVRFVHGSVLDDDAVREAVRGEATGSPFESSAKLVFHLGAVGSVPRSIKEPQRTWSVNSTGTLRVLEAARESKVGRVIYAASSSAYGEQRGSAGADGLAKVETQAPLPMSPYAASKLAGEHLMTAYASSYEISTVSLRLFNVFGPRQPADSAYSAVIAAMTKRILDGQPPLIYGDGRQTRDFTPVSNAVLALLQAGAIEKNLRGETINIGTGKRASVLELAELIAKACGVSEVRPVFDPARAGDVRDSLADLTKAREVLNFTPITTLEEGIAETVAWSKRQFAGA